jgi:GAF domain-containing protein
LRATAIRWLSESSTTADRLSTANDGIRFYAGAPLRTASGHVIGSLCVLDNKPRSLTDRDLKLLQVIADELMGKTATLNAAHERASG